MAVTQGSRLLKRAIDSAGIALVGVEPRTPEQVQTLPPDRRILYPESKAGLVGESLVPHGTHPTDDERRVCDVIDAVRAGVRLGTSILARYFARECGFGDAPSGRRSTPAEATG